MLSEDRLRDMFTSNSDGAGFMFVKNKKVLIRKGFMKFKHLLAAIAEEQLTDKNLIVFHFRIATVGSVSPKNTHPFPLSTSIKELQATQLTTDIGVAHNGIISYEHDKKEDMSDTMTFIRDILADTVIRKNIMEPSIFSLIEMSVGSSKLVFMNSNEEYALVGDWLEDTTAKDGCTYSNLAFVWKSRKPTVSNCSSDVGQVWVNGDWVMPYDNEYPDVDSQANKKYANVSTMFEQDEECPNCKHPIEGKRALFCRKCGIMFEWD